MSGDQPPKSSFELAMERLKKKDVEDGVETRAMTDQQKAAIGEVKSFYGSKIAEQEVLLQSKLRNSVDLAEREAIEQELRRTRERYSSEREAKIEKIRRGDLS
jgi:hypothetical protein